jgi:formate dehydrogenase major subunit
MALRGHASIQGSTDIPTLFNILPGYLPMPHADQHQSLDEWVGDDEGKAGFWGNIRPYAVSLMKSYWGDAATAENDFCFDYLPRLTGDHSSYTTVKAMIEGGCKGYFLVGENPAVGSANGKMQRLGLANLDWLVVRDLQMIESATFWKDGPEIETGELVTEDIGTEIFFLPAAAHTEKAGSFTQTQRMLQWRDKAVQPPDDCRSELDFYFELGQRIRSKLAGSTAPGPTGRPCRRTRS